MHPQPLTQEEAEPEVAVPVKPCGGGIEQRRRNVNLSLQLSPLFSPNANVTARAK